MFKQSDLSILQDGVVVVSCNTGVVVVSCNLAIRGLSCCRCALFVRPRGTGVVTHTYCDTGMSVINLCLMNKTIDNFYSNSHLLFKSNETIEN